MYQQQFATSYDDLNTYISLKHKAEKDQETIEIKLEIFALVDSGNDVFETRKSIIEKLLEQKDIEKVLKLYIDKMYTYADVNNVFWNNADIIITSKRDSKLWKNAKFKQNIFSKCFLWETYETYEGEISREDIDRKRKQN